MRISLVSSIVAALVLPSIVLGQGQSVYSSYGSAYYDVAVENDGVTLSGYDVLDSGMSGPSFCHHNYSLSFYFGDEQGNTVGSGNSLYRTSPANQGVAMRVDASVATNASTNYYAYPSANAFCDCANQTFIATDWNRVAAPKFTYNANDIQSFYANLSLLSGQPVSTLQSWVTTSGVLLNNQGPLTSDNLNVLAVGTLAGNSDEVDPTFNSYVQQMGYDFLAPTTVPQAPVVGAIGWLIRAATAAGGVAVTGALVLGSVLIMTGDHPANWHGEKEQECQVQQEADAATCRSRFPYGSRQGAK